MKFSFDRFLIFVVLSLDDSYTRFFIYKHQQLSTEPGWCLFSNRFLPSLLPYPYPYLCAKMHLVQSPACINEWIAIDSIGIPISWKKIGPNFRLAVLIAVLLINKKACIMQSMFSLFGNNEIDDTQTASKDLSSLGLFLSVESSISLFPQNLTLTRY